MAVIKWNCRNKPRVTRAVVLVEGIARDAQPLLRVFYHVEVELLGVLFCQLRSSMLLIP